MSLPSGKTSAASSSAVLRFAALCLEGASILRAAALAAELPLTASGLMTALVAFRQTHHLSQADMADLCEVTLATWQRWEWGQRQPQVRHLSRLRQILMRPPPPPSPRKGNFEQAILATLGQWPQQRGSYRLLAQRLRRSAQWTCVVCQRLVRAGKLRQVRAGIYALPHGSS